MKTRSPITTHVLDLSKGKPAAGLAVRLDVRDKLGDWTELARAVTNPDGRIEGLLDAGAVAAAGVYRLSFETEAYFKASGGSGFYPAVSIEFHLADPSQHYHVPLLLSPYGYSTYRGS
jgi:5-hydroxyisourate hydrolase